MSTHMLVVKRTEAMLNIDFRKCSTYMSSVRGTNNYFVFLNKKIVIDFYLFMGLRCANPEVNGPLPAEEVAHV